MDAQSLQTKFEAEEDASDYVISTSFGRNVSLFFDSENASGASAYGAAAADDEAFLRVVRVIVPVIFGLIAVLGFTGNLFVIIVVISNKQMRNTTNILIINLALADLAFIVICVPFTAASYVLEVWPFGHWWCKIYQYVIHVTAHESVYTLVLMSFDRYLAVVHPISSLTLRTERNTLIALSASWFVICAANSPALDVFEVFTYVGASNVEQSTCLIIRLMTDPDYGKLFYGTFFFFAFLLPLTLVSFLYGFLIKRLLYHERSRNLATSSDNMRAKRRVTRMVIIVVVIFAVCWLPLQIIFMVQAFGQYPQRASWIAVKLAANCLAYMNSCVNPILYAFLSDNFRKSFRKLLGCFGDFQPLLKTNMERTSIRDYEKPLNRSTSSTVEHNSCL